MRAPRTVSMPIAMGISFLAALIVRLAYVAAFRDSPFFGTLIVDGQWHDEWAWQWAQGHWDMGGQAFFRAPLYPLWLAGLYAVFGHDVVAVRVVQAVLGSLTAALLAGVGHRWGGWKMGLVTGLAAALYGPLVFFDGELLIANLLVFLLAAMLFVLVMGQGPLASGASGLLLGLAAIARPNALLLLPAVGYWIWSTQAVERRRRLQRLALVAALAFAPALVVSAINAAQETWVFIASQGGVNFYAGNHAGASGRTVEIPELSTMLTWRQFVNEAEAVAEAGAGRDLDSGDVSSWWLRRGLRWIAGNFGDAASLYARKLYFLANAREIPDNRDLYFQRPGPLRWLLAKSSWGAFPWGLVFPLAVAGLAIGWGHPAWGRRVRFLGLWLALYAASLLPFFITARFRMAMVPPALLLAALTLCRVQELKRALPMTLLLAAAVLSNSGLAGIQSENRSLELSRLGEVYLRSNRNGEALTVLEEAHRLNPDAIVTDLLLGEAYLREGRAGEAVPLYLRVKAARPEDPAIHFNLGVACLRANRFEEAAKSFETATRLQPQRAASWINLGLAREGMGQLDAAVAAYRKAIELGTTEAIASIRLQAILDARAAGSKP